LEINSENLTFSGVAARDFMNKISASAPQLIRAIPTWNKYKYDRGTNSTDISDGGNDMYDGGNKVKRLKFC